MSEKKPAAVIAAEIALEVKKAEFVAAEETVKRLRVELGDATAAVRTAQTAADASLPQCRMVGLAWRTDKEESTEPVVILRRTPSGILVTRRVGDTSRGECRFKWAAWGGKFVQAEKYSHMDSHRELRDVPAEFLPQERP